MRDFCKRYIGRKNFVSIEFSSTIKFKVSQLVGCAKEGRATLKGGKSFLIQKPYGHHPGDRSRSPESERVPKNGKKALSMHIRQLKPLSGIRFRL